METTVINETAIEMAKETNRLESFSDGVFAIAITLLILDIHVPEIKGNESLLNAFLAEWPGLLALLIGFVTILICWINHHYMFQMIYKSDSTLLLINGFKLLVITVTPISTAILAKYIQTANQQVAVSIYCFNFALMGIAMTGIWSYANSNGLVRTSSSKVLEATTRLYIFAGVFSTIIFLVSFASVWASLVLSGAMFAIFIFPKRTVAWQVGRVNG